MKIIHSANWNAFQIVWKIKEFWITSIICWKIFFFFFISSTKHKTHLWKSQISFHLQSLLEDIECLGKGNSCKNFAAIESFSLRHTAEDRPLTILAVCSNTLNTTSVRIFAASRQNTVEKGVATLLWYTEPPWMSELLLRESVDSSCMMHVQVRPWNSFG